METALHFVYKSLSDDDVIAEIVRQAETTANHRDYCRLACEFIEDCKVSKNAQAIEKILSGILTLKANHSRITTVLRYAFSCRDSIANWYTTKDAALEILKVHEPERYERLLIGLIDHKDPGTREEMDGLNAWEGILKEVKKYA